MLENFKEKETEKKANINIFLKIFRNNNQIVLNCALNRLTLWVVTRCEGQCVNSLISGNGGKNTNLINRLGIKITFKLAKIVNGTSNHLIALLASIPYVVEYFILVIK